MKNHISTISMLLVLLLSSCTTDYDGGPFLGKGIKGEGPITSKILNLEGFTTINLSTSGELYLAQGEAYSIKVEAQQNIIDNLKPKASGRKLTLGFNKPVSSMESLKFYITMPTVTGINVSGASDVYGESPFTGLEGIELNIAGSGNIKLNLEANAIDMSIAGSGNIELEGEANQAEANIMGSGNINAKGLKVQKAEVSIAGSGDCTIDATEQLDVSIAGSGNVYYFGSPQIDKSIAGSGSVEKK